MPPVTEESLSQIVARLRQAAPDATIRLFGSRARADATPESDWDFLVVQPQVTSRRREMARLARVLRPLRIPADVLVFSQADFDRWSSIPGTVLHDAAKEGKVLHASPLPTTMPSIRLNTGNPQPRKARTTAPATTDGPHFQ
ncbi:MAG: nucleotidyltransferase domain-containing protein [Opitutales bacterium]|nr:nucleotidyltransferase domain-containing protein [Opitutales bacterium]